MKVLHKKIILGEKEMCEIINNTDVEYTSVNDPLYMHATVSNEAILAMRKKIINAERQGKKPASVLSYLFD